MSLSALIQRTPSRLVSDSPATGRRTSSNSDANDLSGQLVSAVLGSGLLAKIVASGGTVTSLNGYNYHVFTSSGTFSVNSGGGTVYITMVGGGANCAFSSWGGMNGGGAILEQKFNIEYGRNIEIIVGSSNNGSGGNSGVSTSNMTISGAVLADSRRLIAYGSSFSGTEGTVGQLRIDTGQGFNHGPTGGYANCYSGGGGGGAGSPGGSPSGYGGGPACHGCGSGGNGLAMTADLTTVLGYSHIGAGGGGGAYAENNCDGGCCPGIGYSGAGGSGYGGHATERGCNTSPTGQSGYGSGGHGDAINIRGGGSGTAGVVVIKYLA